MNNFFLCNSHLEQLKASAISLEIATERGYRTVTDKVELTSLGFVRTQLRVPGLLIPQWRVEGMQKDYQLRPGSPRSNKKGKVIKYENPAGSSIHLDCPPRCQKMLANPSILLWISEGSKKRMPWHHRELARCHLPESGGSKERTNSAQSQCLVIGITLR